MRRSNMYNSYNDDAFNPQRNAVVHLQSTKSFLKEGRWDRIGHDGKIIGDVNIALLNAIGEGDIGIGLILLALANEDNKEAIENINFDLRYGGGNNFLHILANTKYRNETSSVPIAIINILSSYNKIFPRHLNAQNLYGRTPLHLALKFYNEDEILTDNNIELFEAMIMAAKPNIIENEEINFYLTDENENTILHNAAGMGRGYSLINFVKNNRIALNINDSNLIAQNYWQRSVLHEAFHVNNISAFESMLEIYKGDINKIKGPFSSTLLHSLCSYHDKNPKFLDLLLDRKDININVENDNKETPIVVAINSESFSNAKKILENKNILNHINAKTIANAQEVLKKSNGDKTKIELLKGLLDKIIVNENKEEEQKNESQLPGDYVDVKSSSNIYLLHEEKESKCNLSDKKIHIINTRSQIIKLLYNSDSVIGFKLKLKELADRLSKDKTVLQDNDLRIIKISADKLNNISIDQSGKKSFDDNLKSFARKLILKYIHPDTSFKIDFRNENEKDILIKFMNFITEGMNSENNETIRYNSMKAEIKPLLLISSSDNIKTNNNEDSRGR